MEEIEKFLQSQKLLRLATISHNGDPHIIPVWYLYENNRIFIGTHTNTQKAKNVKRNKRVSFVVDVGVHSPIYGVMGIGKARLIEEKNTVMRIAKKIMLRYFSSLKHESARELLDETDCIIEVTPEKITSWSF